MVYLKMGSESVVITEIEGLPAWKVTPKLSR